MCECVHVRGVCVHTCLGAAWMKERPMMRGKVWEPIPRPAALSPPGCGRPLARCGQVRRGVHCRPRPRRGSPAAPRGRGLLEPV